MITSRVQRMIRGLGGLLAALVVTACGGGGSGPGGTGADRLVVGSGEELRVAAGTVLSGVRGIDLLGRIVVEPGEGGLTLIAENGDVNLHGSIVVLSAGTIAAGTGAGRARIMAAAGQRSMASAAAAPGVNGGGILVEARGGNIIIGGAHFMITGDGGPAAAVALDALAAGSAVEVEYRAPAGGNAGDIVLRAPSGAVVFRPRDASDPPPFHLGNGGAGADLAVAADLRVASERVFYVAGAGGESGRFDIDAQRVEGASAVVRFFAQGSGGDGGSSTWTPSAAPALPPQADIVTVRGGDGGEGIRSGGRGGDARLQGEGAAHDPQASSATAWTTFAAVGGAGGATTDAAPVVSGAQDEYRGGRGGDANATGHRGWAGNAATGGRGGDGGRVNVFGGGGGAVQADANARGGRGGDASAVSGDGGDGEDRCAVGAGGRGGDAGLLQARAGRGGDVMVPAGGGALVGSGGDGGHVTRAEVGKPGRGGRGIPAGDGGSDGVVIALFGGDGGQGADLGFLGTIPEVVYGLAALPEPCGNDDPVTPSACLDPGLYWYEVTASIVWSDSHTVDQPYGLWDRTESYTVMQSVTVTGSGPSHLGLRDVVATGTVDDSHTITIAGSSMTTTYKASGEGIDPVLTATYIASDCSWHISARGGRLWGKRHDGNREFDQPLDFPGANIGNSRLGTGVDASGSVSFPLACRTGEKTDCGGSAYGWTPGNLPLTAGDRQAKSITFSWSITATPWTP